MMMMMEGTHYAVGVQTNGIFYHKRENDACHACTCYGVHIMHLIKIP
jgi:hypothetical protein